MSFEAQFNMLVYFHLEEHHSGRQLMQVLKEEAFARQCIAPEGGIKKRSFFEDISSRGLPQMKDLELTAVTIRERAAERAFDARQKVWGPDRSRFTRNNRKRGPDPVNLSGRKEVKP